MQIFDVRAEFQGGFTAKRKSTQYIVVHHAADDYPTVPGILDVRTVRNWHVGNNGWPGIGYQEALAEITEGGEVGAYILSDPNLIRANVAGRNDVIFGISALCDFDNRKKFPDRMPSEKWLNALAIRVAAAKRLYPNAEIVGHKEITVAGFETVCPGTQWLVWKPELLRRVNAILNPRQVTFNGITIAPEFVGAFYDSGAVWQRRGVLTPGLPVSESFQYAGNKVQLFERSACRLNSDNSIDWLNQREYAEIKASLGLA